MQAMYSTIGRRAQRDAWMTGETTLFSGGMKMAGPRRAEPVNTFPGIYGLAVQPLPVARMLSALHVLLGGAWVTHCCAVNLFTGLN